MKKFRNVSARCTPSFNPWIYVSNVLFNQRLNFIGEEASTTCHINTHSRIPWFSDQSVSGRGGKQQAGKASHRGSPPSLTLHTQNPCHSHCQGISHRPTMGSSMCAIMSLQLTNFDQDKHKNNVTYPVTERMKEQMSKDHILISIFPK